MAIHTEIIEKMEEENKKEKRKNKRRERKGIAMEYKKIAGNNESRIKERGSQRDKSVNENEKTTTTTTTKLNNFSKKKRKKGKKREREMLESGRRSLQIYSGIKRGKRKRAREQWRQGWRARILEGTRTRNGDRERLDLG